MPAGWPYFAWIDASETVFGPEHLRWDEQVFSFTLAQEEGDPASLTAVIRRPQNEAGDAIGLLGPGRKIWAWFAFDCGTGTLLKFRGRLVGIPTSIFEELVTLEFVARPVDYVAQKNALADTLRVLPYYDEVMIDPARRSDPDVVIEGYTKIWHYDRETHVITVSDEITGEDGLVEFDGASEAGKVLYDGLSLTLASGPLARVDVTAEFNWTQQARGTVDLTGYLLSNWPNVVNGIIPNLTEGNWPKNGSSIGDGWEVANASASDVYDFATNTTNDSSTLIIEESDDSTSRTTITSSVSSVGGGSEILFTPPPQKGTGKITNTWSVSYAQDGDGDYYPSSVNRNFSATSPTFRVQAINNVTLVAGYNAERSCKEVVTFSLFADVQPILTDPEDGEALLLDDFHSVNLSEAIGATIPIGDSRRRSYIATERGNQSIEYLISMARTHLMKRARVVEIAFVPKLSRMPEVSLRKNAFLIEPRVGEALGKIIGYSIALDGSDGRINCEVRMGCTIGRGGSAVAAGGEPTYCTVDYTGADYQQFIGRIVLFDTSVGYAPPLADPNDDGINFLSALGVHDVIEQPLVVTIGANPDPDEPQSYMETKATFKLKSVTGEFSSDYAIEMTALQIPTGYNLEAT